MLKGVSKLLTGDLLKALCDMGHDDKLIIADANFPGESFAKRIIRYPGVDADTMLKEILKVFPLDFAYTEHPALVLDLTESDKEKGMKKPQLWNDFEKILKEEYGKDVELGRIERFDFYERTKSAYLVIQTGEERAYGDIMLVKGCID